MLQHRSDEMVSYVREILKYVYCIVMLHTTQAEQHSPMFCAQVLQWNEEEMYVKSLWMFCLGLLYLELIPSSMKVYSQPRTTYNTGNTTDS